MEKKVRGRGFLVEARKENNLVPQNEISSRSIVSPSQEDIVKDEESFRKSDFEKPEITPAQNPCGRGNILSKILSVNYSSETSTTEEKCGVSTSKSTLTGLGRGQFLAKLIKQPKLRVQSNSRSENDSANFITSGDLDKTFESEETKCLDSQLDELSLGDLKLPAVRKGESGKKTPVSTNYIAIKTDPDKSVFEYFVTFNPEIDFKAFRSKLVNQHLQFRKGIKCYDGASKLFLPDKITSDKLIINTKHPNDDSPVVLTITLKRQLTLKECSALYNILFYNCAKVLGLARLGKGNYDFHQRHNVPQHKLEIWPGYVTSVNEFEGGLLLNCEISHRVLRTETPYEVLGNLSKLNPRNFKNEATKELIGQCVLTRYNNNLYRIDDIDWDKNPMATFKLSNGDDITFIDYYRKQYNIIISDEKQPLLISRSKTKNKDGTVQLICLVPEICHLTGLTDKMTQDMVVMKDIANYTRVTPAQRYYGLKKFLKTLKSNEHAQVMLSDWGLNIADEPIQLDARVLIRENIILKNKMKVSVPSNVNWSKYIRQHGVVRSVDLKHWLFLHTVRDSNLASRFKEMLKKVGPALGIHVYEPRIVPLKNDRIETYILGLRQNISRDTQVVVCLCPTARSDRYSAIKKFCCREIPVPSQVVNCGTIMRDSKMNSVVQNVALQINNKLGGASWAVHVPLRNCMVCGIDTYHEESSNSVGGFVASLDQDFTRWFSKTCIQEPKQELLDGIVFCFVSALKKYLTVNNTLPERVFIFRDGVSDGFLNYVRSHEVQQFLDACRLVANNYNPKLSFIVVSKRINQKFFNCSNGLGDSLENPEPGTVVDHTVTRANYYDFFIVSQFVSVGTAMPSHYIVLHDTNDLKPDQMQRLSYKLCHMYYNWTGTIRVPAPCQYAHKLAQLIGENVKGSANELLDDKLYYL